MKIKNAIFLFGFVIILFGCWYIFFSSESKKDSGYSSHQSFIEKLLSQKGVEKKYFDRNICFSIKEEDTSETVTCFIPNKFEQYIQSVSDVELFKQKLSQSQVLGNVQELSHEEKSPFSQFLDDISPSLEVHSDKYLRVKSELIKKLASGKPQIDDYLKYYYLLSLESDFVELKKVQQQVCTQFHKLCESDKVEVVLHGKVLNQNGENVEGARLRILGLDTKFPVVTNEKGEYIYKIKLFPYGKYRLQVLKTGMNLGTFAFSLPSEYVPTWDFSHDFIVNEALQTAIIDTKNHTIEGTGTSIKDTFYIVHTPWSQYKIPFTSLVHADGTQYIGKVNAYFFEFNKNSKLDDLLHNDIFDDVAGYAGNLMKTFGMPFVVFVNDDGELIHVLASHPMILDTKIQEMKALLTGADKVYQPLTKKDLEFLKQQSDILGGYPIDREFLIKNNLLQFPAWWIYDQLKGTWVNHPVKVVDTQGSIETPFYTRSQK